MSRRSNIRLPGVPYHVGARCNNKEKFPIALDEVWRIMEAYLYFIARAHQVQIEAFVLMPNHFHALLRAPQNNLSLAMNYFMRETSRVINFKAGRINQLYGGRFNRCLIDSDRYYRHAYKYIYRNPVKAKMVNSVLDYPFSTLSALLGKSKLVIPVQDKILFHNQNIEHTLEWLDKAPLESQEREVKNALQKKKFVLAQNIHSRAPSNLEVCDL